ncbi:MAG: alpha-amylase family glycosyl hydrolase [Arenimonas sp.]
MRRHLLAAALLLPLAGHVSAAEYYGTLEPFAKRAVYFLMTDRFVNGDQSNDQRQQGGANKTFDRPVAGAPAGESDNIGYLGGDFKGIENNADYIKAMGFDAIWLTPIVDNPDEAFTGGDAVQWKGMFQDKGKTGYHGYWGSNFYKVDEHLPSEDLDFGTLNHELSERGIHTVLDIVANHGSPAFSMPSPQPKYGQIFDKDGTLVADHHNLPAAKLDPANNPLHRFFNTKTEMVQLSDLNENNPAVMDYLTGAYLQWIDQGADAFRIDTIKHMPLSFWAEFSRRIRAKHPDFFLFAEAFDYDAGKIAPFSWAENGGISVLDFPLKAKLADAFGHRQAGFETLADALHLDSGLYQNPYELMTFYDNHDMPRLDAKDSGFIDAHNWLFTARGIPVIYYGSETGFMRGKAEHEGNRNYYGQQRIDAGLKHPIYLALQRIANIRRESPALQQGLQLNLLLKGDRAAFLRVFQHGDVTQTALVLLNKGDKPARFDLKHHLQGGEWRSAINGNSVRIDAGKPRLKTEVPAHGVEVLLFEGAITAPELITALDRLQAGKARRTTGG